MQLTGRAWGGQSNNENEVAIEVQNMLGKAGPIIARQITTIMRTLASIFDHIYVAVMRWRFTSILCMSNYAIHNRSKGEAWARGYTTKYHY